MLVRFHGVRGRPRAMATTSPATAATRRASRCVAAARTAAVRPRHRAALLRAQAARRPFQRHHASSATSTGTTCRACRSSGRCSTRTPSSSCTRRPSTTVARPPRCSRRRSARRCSRSASTTFPGHIEVREPAPHVPHRRFDVDAAPSSPTSARRSATGSTHGGASVAYISDHQQPTDGAAHRRRRRSSCADGVDLLIHDAQYTPAEFAHKSTGATARSSTRCGWPARSGARRLALFHHDPTHDDDMIDRLAAAAHGVRRGDGRGGVRRPRGPDRRARTALTPWTRSPALAAIVLGVGVRRRRRSAKIVAGPTWIAQARELGAPTPVATVAARRRARPRRAARRPASRRRSPAVVAAVAAASRSAWPIARQLVDGRHPPCACFGAWSQRPLGEGHLAAQRRPRSSLAARRSCC